MYFYFGVFFVKHKTAYDMRISDWSSDVCSSDLFCVRPSAQALLIPQADPGGLASTAYLAGVWGLPWLIAKLYLRTGDDAKRFAGTLALLSLALLPIAITEGMKIGRAHV